MCNSDTPKHRGVQRVSAPCGEHVGRRVRGPSDSGTGAHHRKKTKPLTTKGGVVPSDCSETKTTFSVTLVRGVLDPRRARCSFACAACLRVAGLVRGVLEVLFHWRAPSKVLSSCAQALWVRLHDRDEPSFVREAKTLVVWPMTRMLREEPRDGDESPPWPFGPCPDWRRWAKSRLVVNNRNVQMWFSFWQAKRACESVSQEFAKEALRAHALGHAVDDVEGLDLDFLAGLVRTEISRIRSTFISRVLERPRSILVPPSTAACLEATRSSGGAKGFVGSLVAAADPRRVRMGIEEGVVGIDRKGRRREVVWAHDEGEEPERLYDFCVQMEQPAPLQCESVAVIEPLKVRVITKEPAAMSSLCTPWQKAANAALRRMPDTRLTGVSIEESMLYDLVDPDREEEYDLMWVSADFSDATQNSSSKLGRHIVNETLRGSPDDYIAEACHAGIAPHVIRATLVNLESMQKRGQLMGTKMSFPILCLINLVGVRWTDRLFGLRGKWPCLVNGDDLLCRRPRGWCDLFRRVAGRLGLVVNDKTHVHAEYANMNSTAFMTTFRERGLVSVRRLPYLPVGHLFGQRKVIRGEEGEETFSAIEALRLAAEHGARFFKRMLVHHRPAVARACRGRNLFIPSIQGGMGLSPPPGWKWYVDEAQRTEALDRIFQYRLNVRPLPANLREVRIRRVEKIGSHVLGGSVWGTRPRSWYDEAPVEKERIRPSGRSCMRDWDLARIVPTKALFAPDRPSRAKQETTPHSSNELNEVQSPAGAGMHRALRQGSA